MPHCEICTSLPVWRSPAGEFLCTDCARREIIGLLSDMDEEEINHLRRRAEDVLRKNPSILRETIIEMILKNQIKYTDLI
jgi:hypothetical protein